MRALRPLDTTQNSSYWIDAPLWGNRFYRDQEPEFILLEFLCILNSHLTNDTDMKIKTMGLKIPESENTSEKIEKIEMRESEIIQNNNHPSYVAKVHTRIKTRKLLFGHSKLDEIKRGPFLNKKQEFDDIELGNVKIQTTELSANITSFESFFDLVTRFRDSRLPFGDKRWTSHFLFPYGAECLYLDGEIKNGLNFSADRRFFGRGGELLFFMLKRAKWTKNEKNYIGEDIFKKFSETFLNTSHPINQFFKRTFTYVGDTDKTDTKDVNMGYLPFLSLNYYNNLAEDLFNILSISKLSSDKKYVHLTNIICLYIARYYLGMAQHVEEDNIFFDNTKKTEGKVSTYKWSLVAKYKEILIKALKKIGCKESDLDNDAAIQKLIEQEELSVELIDYYRMREQPYLIYNGTEELKSKPYFFCISSLESNKDLIQKSREVYTNNHFLGQRAVVKLEEQRRKIFNAPPLTANEKEELKKHHKDKCYIHKSYVVLLPKIGLSSSKNSRHYILTPDLLESLVLSLVDERMELSEFLQKLDDRYQIIVGRTKSDCIDKVQLPDHLLKENTEAIEELLLQNGLLKKLSDDCSYVENPYF